MACAAFGALAMALLIWRVDVVRMLPQTATFYRLVGFEVNLRSLAIKDVKISRETVESKPVLVIEGTIMGLGRKPADLPRLRFVVRDDRGTEIYAWNAVLEQTVLRPGEQAWFRSRLASHHRRPLLQPARYRHRRRLEGFRRRQPSPMPGRCDDVLFERPAALRAVSLGSWNVAYPDRR